MRGDLGCHVLNVALAVSVPGRREGKERKKKGKRKKGEGKKKVDPRRALLLFLPGQTRPVDQR